VNSFIAEIKGQKAELRPDESWHCARVLRRKSGDLVQVIDGKGNYYSGTLDLVSDKKCIVSLNADARQQAAAPYHLHLAIAPTKNIDRIEWMLEKVVEIGIQEISFFTSKNSERQAIKLERLQTIIESAVKQSLQACIPVIHPLRDLKNLMGESTEPAKFMAHCYSGDKTAIKDLKFAAQPHLILIGPEGDFSPDEVELAKQHNFSALSLGENRLRTETAGLYVCQAASLLSL
jgi:16S rRNA (uracil1498-N3)-methyltransferase